jgi:SNF2 family DNA or RNA helicase
MDMLKRANLVYNQHQYDGVQFCLSNETIIKLGVYGGVIADEMGLGKTLTVIGTMVANPLANTLIVLPPVLLQQWQKEIFRATGEQALIYHGQQKKTISIRELKSNRVVLTTYNMIRSQSTTRSTTKSTTTTKKATTKSKTKTKQPDANLLHQVQWDRVIFDEAHHLRNKNLAHMGAIELDARIRWLITGTPIQNNVSDFYNLCAVMGLDASIYSDKEMSASIIATLVLKRTKRLVPSTNLPEVITHVIDVDWRADERLARDVHCTLQFTNTPDTGGLYTKKIESTGILQRMMRAKQCCILPSLIQDDLKKFKLDGKYATSSSSKIDAVIDTVCENAGNGSGKLIFCHFRNEIDVISERLKERGVRSATFDGRTSSTARQAILSDPNVGIIILQIQTGCEGLNLQENYSEVYFVSPHWNPSVEAQAIGRCHRMGQKKQVYVYRFEMAGFSVMGQTQGQQQWQQQQEGQEDEDEEQEDEQKRQMSMDKYIRTVQLRKQDMTDEVLNHK